MAADFARDVHLGVTLAYLFSIVLHAVLAAWTLERAPSRDARIFAAANGLLSLSLVIQLVEFGLAIGRFDVDPRTVRGLLGSQLLANLLVLGIFFQLLSTFAGRDAQTRTSMRVRLIALLRHRARFLVPAVYGVIVLAGLLYLSDLGGIAGSLRTLRETIGPTSAYVFGASLWLLVFVMFPARPGQEHLAVPVTGRALLLTSLGVTIGLVALWHDTRPRMTREVLLPILHLHSIPVAVFLALVRYEFSFMDRYVLGTLRALGWSAVVVVAYWIWNRVPDVLPNFGALGMSTSRIAVLLAAVSVAPWVARGISGVGERVLFARTATLESLQRRFAERLAEGKGLGALIEATCGDVSEALRARGVRVVVGSARNGNEPVRLEVPLEIRGEVVGSLLLGDRRDLLPYFDGERRLIRGITPLLAGAIAAFRQRRPQAVDENGAARALASETPARPTSEAAREGVAPAPRKAWPEPTVTLSSRWQSEVLSAAARVGEKDTAAGARILTILDRAAAHLKADGGRQVALAREFEFARDLVALETLRRENQLDAKLHYPHELATQAVPRGVVLHLMAKAIAASRGDGGWSPCTLDLRAREIEGRVEIVIGGEGIGALRAQFPRRDVRRVETS